MGSAEAVASAVASGASPAKRALAGRVTERRELAALLDEAVHRLRPDYAELITLRYEHDLTLEDVAEVTGLPAGTVKSSLYRARKDLADYLRRRGWSNK